MTSTAARTTITALRIPVAATASASAGTKRSIGWTVPTLRWYVLGREDGLPYVFVDMNTLPNAEQDDRFDDPIIVAGIRFHNLCLADTGGISRRPDLWRIEMPNAIGWQRGTSIKRGMPSRSMTCARPCKGESTKRFAPVGRCGYKLIAQSSAGPWRRVAP